MTTRRSAARAKTMSQIRPWQAALFVVAILVLGGSVVWSVMSGRGAKHINAIHLVDVTNGDRFIVDVSGHAAAMYPEKNPDTGEYSLWPAHKDDEGVWRLEPRAMAELRELKADRSAVDDSTGKVEVTDRSPRKIRPAAS